MKKRLGALSFVIALVVSVSLMLVIPIGASPGSGIIGLWYLDEGSGTTAYDSSGNGHNVTISGASWTTNGKLGSALSFNGVSDYAYTLDPGGVYNLDGFSGLTLAAWIKPDKVSGEQAIISKYNTHTDWWSYFLSLSGDELRVGVAQGTSGTNLAHRITTAANLVAGSWVHVAGTWDGSELKLFVNGAEAPGTTTVKGTFPATMHDSNIQVDLGAYESSGGTEIKRFGFFDGVIDEVSIWNEALTASQISTLACGVNVTWLPPVTNTDFALKDGTTLPLKFQLFDNSGLVSSERQVSLEVTGPPSFTPIIFQLGEGAENFRWNADECHYIANIKTNIGNWPTGTYTATVSLTGISIGTTTFELSVEKGIGRGNSN